VKPTNNDVENNMYGITTESKQWADGYEFGFRSGYRVGVEDGYSLGYDTATEEVLSR
jgi:hypothetical protein